MRISNHNNGLCTIRTGTGRAAAAATTTTITRRSLSSSADDSGGGEPPPIRQLGKLEMQEIFNDIDSDGREGSECVVIDVRGEDEIMFTGKISECVETLPLPIIAQYGVFNMESEEFEAAFGFAKPTPDETIIFTCKAGIRSMHAAQFAARCGYSKLCSYSGGSDDWFN